MKRLPLLLLATSTLLSLASCGEAKMGAINSLKDGFLALNTQRNYTFNYSLNNIDYKILFTDKSIGFTSDIDKTSIYHYIQDKKGIYPLNYCDEEFAPGEYLKDNENNNYQSLWDNSFYKTMYHVETDFVKSIGEDISELVITNKQYKINLIQSLGFADSQYININSITAKYQNNSFFFEIAMQKMSKPLVFTMQNLNKTKDEAVEQFLGSGGKHLTPDSELTNMRDLLRGNNFRRLIHDVNKNEFVGTEVFTEDYFYSELDTSSGGSGAMECVQAANETHPDFDLLGCYNFNANGTLHKQNMQSVTFFPTAMYETPNIVEMYHYPTYLKLLDNLQYVKEGAFEEYEYQCEGKSYVVKNDALILDFVKNNSFDQAYDPSTYAPAGLQIDIFTSYRGEEYNKITFIYYFRYGGRLYPVVVPFYAFGKANVPLLDAYHKLLND